MCSFVTFVVTLRVHCDASFRADVGACEYINKIKMKGDFEEQLRTEHSNISKQCLHLPSLSLLATSLIHGKNTRLYFMMVNLILIEYRMYRVAQKNGARLSHCKYSENSMTKLRGNWW